MKYLFSFSDDIIKTEFKADYGQLLNYFKNNSKEEIAESFKINESEILSKCLNDSPSFKGGVFQDIFKDVVIDTKKDVGAKATANLINKRKRFLSEHDGDYVHERRYDINFMESARREKVQGSNLIKINACASFSAGVDHKNIDNYAREVCELVNFYESQGRNVELNLFYKTKNAYYGAPNMTAFITVKRPDKYLSKSDIYRAFSAVFFRHIGFCVIVALAEINNKQVGGNLGTPEVKDNYITVTSDDITIHGMTRNLLEKIKQQNKESA